VFGFAQIRTTVTMVRRDICHDAAHARLREHSAATIRSARSVVAASPTANASQRPWLIRITV
jgi:hypothetical protein